MAVFKMLKVCVRGFAHLEGEGMGFLVAPMGFLGSRCAWAGVKVRKRLSISEDEEVRGLG